MIRQLLFRTMVLLPAFCLLGQAAEAKPPLSLAVTRQQFRNEYIRFEALIDALSIRPGMTILDIGAGPGYASFLLAERLKGTGAVFATDIRQDFVDYIAQEARIRNISNLFSARVNEYGLDDFYTRHYYDLVFLSNVYHCLDNRVEYFRKLRRFLKPGAKLVFILYNEVPLFTVDDLADVDGLINSLSENAGEGPFVLSPGTRQLLKDKSRRAAFERSLVEDFNRLLVDPQFYKNFYSGFYFKKDLLTPSERDFADWLLMNLSEEGVLENLNSHMDAKSMRMVIKLNKLFFIKRFGKYLYNEGRGAYLPAGDANRHMSKYVVLRELGEAGFALSREIQLSAFFNAVILERRKP